MIAGLYLLVINLRENTASRVSGMCLHVRLQISNHPSTTGRCAGARYWYKGKPHIDKAHEAMQSLWMCTLSAGFADCRLSNCSKYLNVLRHWAITVC